MAKTYDVVIVGAGPGGLMSAKVAAESGLRVALIERKEQITEVQRCCATMFAVESDYYFGERMFFNERQSRFIFPVTGFSLKYDGPYQNFYGWHIYTSDASHYIRLGDYDANVAKGDQGRLSMAYSKTHLLTGLLRDAQVAGAEIFNGENVIDHRRRGSVNEIYTASGKVFTGVFTVAADGVNSRLVKILNLNKQRSFFGTMKGINYYMTGLKLPHPYVLIMPTLYDRKSGYPISYFLKPSPFAKDEYWVYVGGAAHPEIDYKERLDYFIYESPFKSWFVSPKVRKELAHVHNIWSPVPTPYKDYVLIVGDAGWTIEAECTGSMMAGLKAGFALAEAFKENKLNQEGVQHYIDWWYHHFPNSQNYIEFLQIMVSPLIGEEESNYLFRLVTETLPSTLNPFNLYKYINGAIAQKVDRIQKERPDVLAKMMQMSALPLEAIMNPFKRTGFPNC